MPKRLKLTKNEILKKLDEVNPNRKFEIIGEFSGRHSKVYVQDDYGVTLTTINSLLKGYNPTIQIALDKNSYFINQVKEIHGDKYDYRLVEYINNYTKVKIICSKEDHGVFEQNPTNHLQGQGCRKCRQYTKISNSRIKSFNRWTHSKWLEVGMKSKHFDSFKLYVIKCWNETERFYKVGKTFNTMEIRFKNKRKMPYHYNILFSLTSENGILISQTEEKILKLVSNFKYHPLISFDGMSECFIIPPHYQLVLENKNMSNKFISRNRVSEFLKNYLEANMDDIKEACADLYDEETNEFDLEKEKLFNIHFEYIMDKLEKGI